MKIRVCFVVQRYGLEVNGGAELHCRQLAEHMAEDYHVEVVTTKATDYTTWANAYTEDIDSIHGISIRRFPVEKERDLKAFDRFSAKAFHPDASYEDGIHWMELQGPYVPGAVQYIETHAEDYDIFIFFTYLYYLTFTALPKVRQKAILIPTAHDEPPIYQKIFKGFFSQPGGIFYNTIDEKQFIERKFHNHKVKNNNGNGGVGVDLPASIDAERFRRTYGLDNYLLYVGRIDASKGCDELFRYFKEYKKRNPGSLKLVLIGKPVLPVPKDPDIISLGFVTDEDKFDGMAGARMLVLPSRFESLSMVVLEAMALGIPVVVTGWCGVLKGHCTKSNAGLYYLHYFEFEGAVNYLLTHEEQRTVMGENGKAYVEENYQWDVIVSRLGDLIEAVLSDPGPAD